MAETDPILQSEMAGSEEQRRLKYLEFVQVAALQAVLCASKLYGCAKNNSGPLKPSVDAVEGTVKTVVGPVYHKFHEVPVVFLKFVDRKVDESVGKLDGQVPPFVKQVSTQAFLAAQKAPATAQAVVSEVQKAGVIETAAGLAKTVYTKCEPTAKELYSKCEPAAKELYSKYEPVAEQYAIATYRTLSRLPLFPQVVQVVVPTAGYCTEKYNEAVKHGVSKGYMGFSHLPVIPLDKIAKAFEEKVAN